MKKKVLALALALVLVLSMTSAFAQNCLSFDWSKTTKCGTGKVEVITYVKCNDGGTNNAYLPNTGAAAVFGENVYFAIKLTVEENPNKSWWDEAILDVEATGVTITPIGGAATTAISTRAAAAYGQQGGLRAGMPTSLSAGVYYVTGIGTGGTAQVVKESNFSATPATAGGSLWTATVTNANTAQVCAKLKSSEYVALNTWGGAGMIELDGYLVGTDATVGTQQTFNIRFDNTQVQVINGEVTNVVIGTNVYSGTCAGGYTGKDANGNNITAVSGCGSDYTTINDIFSTFGLSFGMEIDAQDVIDVLGWDTSVKACGDWSAKACAVVDCNVAVEIPKTGDVSVIAYAVMALVAAAGAMGLKK